MMSHSSPERSSIRSIHEVLAAALSDHEVGWSMGSFGALAEFHQDAGEPAVTYDPTGLCRATNRGAIRLAPGAVARSQPIAYEQLSKNRERWGQGVALCLPFESARGSQRSKLTRIGPDEDAIRDDDHDAILFDMGLGLVQCDFHVRTRNPDLINILNDNVGRSILDPDNPAMAEILRDHPHRIAITPVGRIEVFQKIGGPDTGGRSPLGPHTHVLPKFMRAGRTHAGNITVPQGLIPCAYMHPGNPLVNGIGERRAFDRQLARKFAELYQAFAPAELRALKSDVAHALAEEVDADTFAEPSTRAGRITLRVSLRQLLQFALDAGDTDAAARVMVWRSRFDSQNAAYDDEPDEQVDHQRYDD